MSLKAFHIFFIFLSIVLSVGCAVWGFAWANERIFGGVSAVITVALIIYGLAFLKKSKRIIT
jgi:F0F1-type ATP synthase assembly protein I